MTKKHEEQKQTEVAALSKKLQRKLELAQAEQKDAARKVGMLRSRLQTAETRLARRAQRVDKLQVRMQPKQSAGTSAEAPGETGSVAANAENSAVSDMHLEPRGVETSANGSHSARGARKRTHGK